MLFRRNTKKSFAEDSGQIAEDSGQIKELEGVLDHVKETSILPEEEPEGELVVDVYQTPGYIVIQSPVAGVKEEDLDITIEGDRVTIFGRREKEEVVDEKDYFRQECYWGAFSRTLSLPTNEVDIERAEASLKNGILTVRIPTIEKKRAKKLKVAKG